MWRKILYSAWTATIVSLIVLVSIIIFNLIISDALNITNHVTISGIIFITIFLAKFLNLIESENSNNYDEN